MSDHLGNRLSILHTATEPRARGATAAAGLQQYGECRNAGMGALNPVMAVIGFVGAVVRQRDLAFLRTAADPHLTRVNQFLEAQFQVGIPKSGPTPLFHQFRPA